MPARSALAGPFGTSPALAMMSHTSTSCPKPSSTTSVPRGARSRRRVSGDGAISGKSIRAAIERQTRIVVPDIRLQMIDIAGLDIGRIGHNKIERAAQGGRKIAGSENARAAKAADRRHWRVQSLMHRRCDPFQCRMRSAIHATARAGSRRSRCRDRRCATRRFCDRATASSAASTTVSVSGRGTSVPAESRKRRLQNSECPIMRAIGSRLRRRVANAPTVAFASRARQ